MKKGNIDIFTTDKGTEIEVQLEQETTWLSLNQMSGLFERDKSVISRHLANVFKEGELDKRSVVAKSATTASDGKTYNVDYYNLDAIISVGYRVNSYKGTQFRQWATQRLRDYLIQGYAINEKRLAQKQQEVRQLKTGIQILTRVIEDKAESEGYEWLQHFSKGLELLDDYDHEQLDKKGLSDQKAVYLEISECYGLIEKMKADFNSDIFGQEKNKGLKSSLNQISKGFGDEDFYPSIEEKAATLLYLIVKNHSFVDGNKRIAAACFLLFLERNEILHNKEGTTIISNQALASLTLFVAASKAEEMDIVKQLIISILNRIR